MYISAGQRLTSIRCLLLSPSLCFLRQLCQWIWSLVILLEWSEQAGDLLASTNSALRFKVCRWISMWVLGSKLRSAYFSSKYFTQWAISPGHQSCINLASQLNNRENGENTVHFSLFFWIYSVIMKEAAVTYINIVRLQRRQTLRMCKYQIELTPSGPQGSVQNENSG